MKYFVCWRTWNRDSPKWRAILKFQRCKSLEKAERMKKNLLKQTKFIDVWITELTEHA